MYTNISLNEVIQFEVAIFLLKGFGVIPEIFLFKLSVRKKSKRPWKQHRLLRLPFVASEKIAGKTLLIRKLHSLAAVLERTETRSQLVFIV